MVTYRHVNDFVSRASRSCGLKLLYFQHRTASTFDTSFTLVWIKIEKEPKNKLERSRHELHARSDGKQARILIHTSVKLVTIPRRRHQRDTHHFNPHEREARDLPPSHQFLSADNFNPHEREARDCNKCLACGKSWILIHTSVKLVTQGAEPLR